VKIEQELEKRILTTEQKQKNDIFCDISSKQFSIQVISCAFSSSNKFGFASNIWDCLSANITIHSVVTGIISEPQKLQTSRHRGIYDFQL
jgi:hypothetical protein